MPREKSCIEIVLMPLMVALVGIGGTYFIAKEQGRSADTAREAQLASTRELATADRQIRLLEVFAERITSTDENQRIAVLRLLREVDPELAERLANAVSEAEPEESEVRRVAEEVAEEAAARGYSFAVVGSFRKFKEAERFARSIMGSGYEYEPEIYLAENAYYGVSLGGYLTYKEALKRVNYAKSSKIAEDAYVWSSRIWGENLLK